MKYLFSIQVLLLRRDPKMHVLCTTVIRVQFDNSTTLTETFLGQGRSASERLQSQIVIFDWILKSFGST